ncbi:hypothetical protein DL98DRAFT_599954 [Cadophora sp. DSE1049]|nr:hypothetical protein DL98DRAFT_599954 [Cadophora sp. DSE1049]
MAVDGVRDTTDKFPNSDPATNAPSEVIQKPVNKATSAAPSTLFEKPPSNNPIAETTTGTTTVSAEDHSNNTTALYTAGGDAPTSDPGADCIETTTCSLPPNEPINTKRSVLDESSNPLEIVLEALKTQNTHRIANSTVPGTCTVLTHTDPAVFARIITSIGMNCVDSNFAILASALEIEKQRLRECERNRLHQIERDRKQMNMLFAARSKREEEYREEQERLVKETEKAIACLSMRDFADRDLKDVLSEPAELMGDFKEEDEFEKLIREVDRENAYDAKRRGRASVKETHYWPIIKRRANMIGPLPESSGRKTGVTTQEKYTARRLVMALGYGCSRNSILKARSYLKLLSDLREAGVTLLLLYRTRESSTHFLRHPNELAMVLSWNHLYHPHLNQLRLRAVAQADGDFSGRCDLEDQDIFHRRHVPQGVIWRDDFSYWGDFSEKDN